MLPEVFLTKGTINCTVCFPLSNVLNIACIINFFFAKLILLCHKNAHSKQIHATRQGRGFSVTKLQGNQDFFEKSSYQLLVLFYLNSSYNNRRCQENVCRYRNWLNKIQVAFIVSILKWSQTVSFLIEGRSGNGTVFF